MKQLAWSAEEWYAFAHLSLSCLAPQTVRQSIVVIAVVVLLSACLALGRLDFVVVYLSVRPVSRSCQTDIELITSVHAYIRIELMCVCSRLKGVADCYQTVGNDQVGGNSSVRS